MFFELFIAVRYLRARRHQAVIGLVTALSVLGVAAGVASLIVALSITAGMRRDLQERLLGASAHVELTRVAGDGITDWRALERRLAGVPGVEAVAPALYGQVLLSRGPRSGGALLKGVLPRQESRVGRLLASVQEGSAAALAAEPNPVAEPSGEAADTPPAPPPPLVLGRELAATLGAAVGDLVLVTSPQGELTPLGVVPRFQRFQVVGIFSSGFYQYDSSLVLVPLTAAQRLFSEPDVVTVLSVRLRDLNAAPALAAQLQVAAGPGFAATTWQQQNRELFRALRLEQVVTVIVLTLMVVVAALNILIALTMLVMEKTRDIAVLMSMGVRARQIHRIFLLQGLLICTVGTALGLVVGYAAAWAGGHFGLIHLDASVYALSTLPFAPSAWHAVLIAPSALLIGMAATLYPAAMAARILPAEALRYE